MAASSPGGSCFGMGLASLLLELERELMELDRAIRSATGSWRHPRSRRGNESPAQGMGSGAG
jgi:hypothetical protein